MRSSPASSARSPRRPRHERRSCAAGLVGHGLKDLWQHRTQFVRGTRWWPPFCMVIDLVVAAIIAVEIAAGLHFG